MKLRFWFAAMWLFEHLDWSDAYLWAVRGASDATDWGSGVDCSNETGAEPF